MARKLLSTKELAETLDVSRRTIYKLVSRGLPHQRLGPGERARFRFSLPQVREWLQKCAERPAHSQVGRHDAGAAPTPYEPEFLGEACHE